MITRSLILFFSLYSCLLAEPVLRISKVVNQPSDDANTAEKIAHTYTTQHGEERKDILWIDKDSIVTDADINRAAEEFGKNRSIVVQLNKAGGAKLRKATSKKQTRNIRLAIIVDGKVVSAPTVLGELGDRFVIHGLENYDDREFQDLIQRLNAIAETKN